MSEFPLDNRKVAELVMGLIPSLTHATLKLMSMLLLEARNRRTLDVQISREQLMDLTSLTLPTLVRRCREMEARGFFTMTPGYSSRPIVYRLNLQAMEDQGKQEMAMPAPAVRKRTRRAA